MPILWLLMNAEAFKAEQIFRKHQIFQESLQRVVNARVRGSNLYAFGLPVPLLQRAVAACSCRIHQCVVGGILLMTLFVHQTLTSFLFMSPDQLC